MLKDVIPLVISHWWSGLLVLSLVTTAPAPTLSPPAISLSLLAMTVSHAMRCSSMALNSSWGTSRASTPPQRTAIAALAAADVSASDSSLLRSSCAPQAAWHALAQRSYPHGCMRMCVPRGSTQYGVTRHPVQASCACHGLAGKLASSTSLVSLVTALHAAACCHWHYWCFFCLSQLLASSMLTVIQANHTELLHWQTG